MKLTQEDYQRIRTLFFEALDLKPDQRLRLVNARTADSPALRNIVNELLARASDPTEALKALAFRDDDPAGLLALPVGERPVEVRDRIGSYRIVRVLGEGSMGTVFEAEQERPRRTVALKVTKGLSAPRAIRRFEHESHILGLLQHPGIAQIYNAGTADIGGGPRPYFAMELVRGVPVLRYAKREKLSRRRKLELVAEIAEAVHHAHQKGVIHRDLKPDNILVDSAGRPKILDFGVARLTELDVQLVTLRTDPGQLIGTVPYMSPEQASGRPDEVDIRSDVYALGVILFQLLTDRLPYEVRGVMIHDALRIIREEEPSRLGAADPGLRGDLDAIAARALEKNPQRRYQSAQELAADIRRYLDDQPVVARPPSAWYQLRKYARRHKELVGAAAAAFLLLVLGIVGTSFGLYRATGERRIAEQREREALAAQRSAEAARSDAESARDQAEAVTEYLTSMLASASPAELGRDVLVRDVLEQASESIEARFSDKPLIAARLRHTIGVTYRELGDLKRAAEHVEAALATRKRVLSPEHEDVLASANTLGGVYLLQGRFAEAEPLLRAALKAYRAIHGPDHAATLSVATTLATTLEQQGRYGEAGALAEDTLKRKEDTLGPEHPETITTRNTLAVVRGAQGDFAGAETFFTANLAVLRRVLGPQHPDTLSAMSNLCELYQVQGRLDDAEPLCAEALELRRRTLGEDHHRTLLSMNNLATLYWRLGAMKNAEDLFTQTLAGRRRTLGNTHRETLNSMYNLAIMHKSRERFEEAEKLLAESLRLRREVLGAEHADTLNSMAALCNLLLDLQRLDDAEPLCTETLEIRRRTLGPEHPATLGSMNGVGRLYTTLGRYQDAEEVLSASVAIAERTLPAGHWTRGTALAQYGRCLRIQGKYDEAEKALLAGHEGLSGGLGPQHQRTLEVAQEIADFYAAWGRKEAAAEWRTRSQPP